MKKILAFLFLLIAINATAQTEAAEDTTAKPAITGFGKDDGAKTELKIGKEGGTLSSSDGKIKLIIPEGAVTKKINFSIQPVTNLMPNGNGAAYRLEPSGIQFQKPVQIFFNYDAEEIKDSMQFLLGIAMQDEKGQWYNLNKTELDTVAKNISGNINHFSTWASFEQLSLIVPKRLKVKKQAYLLIRGVSSKDESSEDEVAPLTQWKTPVKTVWLANGIVKGDSKTGTLQYGERHINNFKNIDMNTYTAPDKLPVQNPVAISVVLTGASVTYKIGKSRIKSLYLFLSEEVLIYDNAYEVTMINSFKEPGGENNYYGTIIYKDTGSFVVSVAGKEAKVIEKKNKNTQSEVGYKGQCKTVVLQPGAGFIHILGVNGTRVIPPATADGNASVEIFFKRAPVIFPLLQYTCPHLDGKGTFTETPQKPRALAAMLPAFPINVKFELKDEEQTILELGKEGDGVFVKFTVKKLKDD
jgi:hypothetical protein